MNPLCRLARRNVVEAMSRVAVAGGTLALGEVLAAEGPAFSKWNTSLEPIALS